MAKILASAVVILTALWLIPDSYALENKHKPYPEGFDFYYDDGQSSLKESTHHGHSSKPKTEESEKNEDHKNVDKPGNSRGPPENIANWNLKRILQYVVSLLHSINGNDGHAGELSDEHKYEREPYSKNNKLKTNRTNNFPRKYYGANSDNISNTEFENSGDGNNSEYYDEESLNYPPEKSQIRNFKAFKANMSKEPEVQNRGGISEDPLRNHDDNYKVIPEVFDYHRVRAKDSSSRAEQVSGEFIDEKINRPPENGFVKDDGKSTNNQSIISNESGKQMHTTLNKSVSERNVPKTEDGKLINAQHPNSSKIITKMNMTLNKGLGDKPPLLDSLSGDKPFFSDADRNKDNPITNSSMIKSNFASYNSKASANLPKPGEATIFNFTPFNSPWLEKDFYVNPSNSKIFNENSNFPKEIKLSQSNNSQIPSIKKDMYDKSTKNLSVLHDSPQENQSLNENRSLNPEPQLQSKEKSDNTSKLIFQYQQNNTKGLALQSDFNSPDILLPQNDPINTESRNKSDIPTEQHLVTLDQHPKPEEKQNRTFFNTSDELKTRGGSDTGSDSSERSSSEESYEDDEYDGDLREMPEFIDHFKEIISNATSHLSQNVSTPNTNYSMETELPSSFKNQSSTKKFLKTQEIFDSILEFIYRYSNNPLFTSMRKQKNVTG